MPPSRFHAAVWLAFAGISSPSFASPRSPADGGADRCADEVRELSRWLASSAGAAENQSLLLPLLPSIHLVAHPGRRVREGILIELGADQLRVEGGPSDAEATSMAEQLPRVDEALQRRIRVQRLLHASQDVTTSAVLAVDRDTPWSRIAAVAGRLSKLGVGEVQWMFADPVSPPVVRPEPCAITRDLATIEDAPAPSEKARLLAIVSERIFSTCPHAARTMGELASIAPGERIPFLVEKLPEGVAACRCTIDLPSLKALLHASWGPRPDQPNHAAVTTRLANHGRETLIRHPPESPWSRTFRDLVRREGQTVTLQVMPAGPSPPPARRPRRR